jgi:hypothetical protein
MPDPSNIYERLNLEEHLHKVLGNVLTLNLKDAAGDLL